MNIVCPRCHIRHDSLHIADGEMRGYCASCIVDCAEYLHDLPKEQNEKIPTDEEMYEVWREDFNDGAIDDIDEIE